jgi:hypothetical protein
MELTKARVVSGEEADIGRDHDLVKVEETVELDGTDMERVINKLMMGEFDHTSERGRWERLKDIGLVTERNEKISGGF